MPSAHRSAWWPRRCASPAAEHGYQGEVARVRGLAGRSEQGLELQVSEPQGGRFRWDRRAADMLGGWMLQEAVDDASAVEPGRDREAPRDSGGLEPADLL